MNTTDSSRFSHITIGKRADGAESSEEEIELIGAVELVEVLQSRKESEEITSPAAVAKDDSLRSADSQDRTSAPSAESSRQPDSELDGAIDGDEQPMLLARTITLVLCVLGIIAAAVYIMDYWGVINLPF